jgi:hypothetical protein
MRRKYRRARRGLSMTNVTAPKDLRQVPGNGEAPEDRGPGRLEDAG